MGWRGWRSGDAVSRSGDLRPTGGPADHCSRWKQCSRRSYLYFGGLGYTLLLNAIGIGLIVRAWREDLYVLRGTVIVPKAFLVSIGLLLQVPGLFYLGVGAWGVCTAPGVDC